MAEDTQGTQEAEAREPQAQAEPQGEAERDWRAEYEGLLASSRKWERRAKDNAEKARAYDELTKAAEADAERAEQATRRAEEAEARVAEFERRDRRASLVAEVAREAGVDAELLARMSGEEREDVEANAAFLAERARSQRIYPSVTDNGQQGAQGTTPDISAIRDPAERVRARAREVARGRMK